MSILKKFTASVAGATLTTTSLVTSLAMPEIAQAQTIRDPQSCRQLDYERQRIAREESNIARNASRDIGNAVRNGLGGRHNGRDLGDVLGGAIGGGAAQILIPRAIGVDKGYVRQLEARCAEDRQLLEVGVCQNRSSERGYVATYNGQVSGAARGGIDERRDCTSQTFGSPGNRTLTGGGGGSPSSFAVQQERSFRAQENTYAKPAGAMQCEVATVTEKSGRVVNGHMCNTGTGWKFMPN